jgi:GT2 family glycosyltransferase
LNTPHVTFILASHNRRDIVLSTLANIKCSVPPDISTETIVVDNASDDGTTGAIAERFPDVRVISCERNWGSCGKGWAVEFVRGPYTVFLDDDSHPRPGSIEAMIRHFEQNPKLGAAGFVVHLPDGTRECSALPSVFVGCGVGFRTSALRSVGGLDAHMFMQAEEYDLSFRLIQSGWQVETFGDLAVDHLKTPRSRVGSRTTYYDTRNNLILVDRYLPEPYDAIYRREWSDRYRWLANISQHRGAYWRGRFAAALRGRGDRRAYAKHRLTPEALETLFRFDFVAEKMATLRESGVKRIVLADLGKNVYAFHRGAAKSGLSVLGVADDRFKTVTDRYRDVPVIACDAVESLKPDCVVVSNTSPVHAAKTRESLASRFQIPVHLWFDEPAIVDPADSASTGRTDSADSTPDSASATTEHVTV